MWQPVAYSWKEKRQIPLFPIRTALPLHQKTKETKVITLKLKKYNYENDGIKPNDRSPLQQLCIGKQRVSREPQEGSEENFDVSLQVPHVHQPRISPVR